MNDNITILCSGFGLGFYIPGVLLKKEFLEEGYEVDILVFEEYMKDVNQEHIDDNRREYHENFAKALIAARLPLNIVKSIDEGKVEKLLYEWRMKKKKYFISLSGHWIYILEQYKTMVDWEVDVEGLYVDADLAPSWKSLGKYVADFEEKYNPVCLYDKNLLTMKFSIGTSLFTPIEYSKRQNSVVVHGGGWGMGTYREKVEDLVKHTNYDIKLLAYSEQEMTTSSRITSYMNDPNWCAWKQKGECGFPTYRVKGKEDIFSKEKKEQKYHWLLDLTASQLAIVAKPGAGTLIDSFITETPVVMLKPFGKHEEKNWQIWENLGFGLDYGKWEKSGFAKELLDNAHKNINKFKRKIQRYCDEYLKRFL